jgi:integrase
VAAEEVAALLGVCVGDASALGARDAGLLALLSGAGLRDRDLVQLNFQDLDTAAQELRLPSGDDLIYLSAQTMSHLAEWFSWRGEQPGPMFHPVSPAGDLKRTRISRSLLNGVLRRRCAQARTTPFTPDDVYRTQNFMVCARWTGTRSIGGAIRGDIIPVPFRAQLLAAAQGPQGSAAGFSARIAPPAASVLFRYLSRLDAAERVQANAALDRLASILAGVPASAADYPWTSLTAARLPSLDTLLARNPLAEIDRMKRALNGVLREAADLGLMKWDHCQDLLRVSWVRQTRRPPVYLDLTVEDMERLLRICMADVTHRARRDAALLGITWLKAAGPTEISALQWTKGETLPLRGFLGGPEPQLEETIQKVARSWLQVRGGDPGPLLTIIGRNDEVILRPMSRSQVEYVVRARGEQAGYGHLTPEDIRRASIQSSIQG